MARRAITATLLLIVGTAYSQEDFGGRDFDDVGVVGLAPGPDDNGESIIHVYAARSYEPVPRMVAVHTWIAYRRAGERQYTLYEAHRFRPHISGRSVRTCKKDYPDRRWHGAAPTLLFELAGEPAERAIAGIEEAVSAYPGGYRLWPGPNSNTLIAALVRSVDELEVDLPPTAIGKDFLPGWGLFGPAPSGTGWQVSLGGAFSVLIALEEGVEINLFGAVFGLDLSPPAFKLPVVGRLGFPQGRRPDDDAIEASRHLPRETRCH
jgi:Protein of unknown function (DUF3750)